MPRPRRNVIKIVLELPSLMYQRLAAEAYAKNMSTEDYVRLELGHSVPSPTPLFPAEEEVKDKDKDKDKGKKRG